MVEPLQKQDPSSLILAPDQILDIVYKPNQDWWTSVYLGDYQHIDFTLSGELDQFKQSHPNAKPVPLLTIIQASQGGNYSGKFWNF